jgi:hypothetical protein
LFCKKEASDAFYRDAAVSVCPRTQSNKHSGSKDKNILVPTYDEVGKSFPFREPNLAAAQPAHPKRKK